MSKINLLVNGCSFSCGPESWPYYLSDVNITNLACAGAGNTYIHDSTIAELASRSYDFVAIMWTGLTRVDLQVDDITQFSQSKYTSQYQSTRNDWAEKIIEPFNDQDYVEKNWIFGCGHINAEPELLKTRAFESIYQYQSATQLTRSSLIKMISLQSILKQYNLPYLFMYYGDYEKELYNFSNLYKMLDQQNIFNDQNIYNITERNNWFADDNMHPGATAHKTWASLINPLIHSK